MTRSEFVKRLQAVRTLLRERAGALRRREDVFGRPLEIERFIQELAELEVRVRGGAIRGERVLRVAVEVSERWPCGDPLAHAIVELASAYRELE